ncbi:hypothetical protein B0H14DRAFT_3565027, partial [Mycena olivaceomarginata]
CPQLESRPGLPTPSAAPRFRGAAARTSRVWLRAAIVFFIQICPSPLPTRRAMVPTSSKSRGTHTARTRRKAPASLVPAGGRMRSGRSARRSGGAFGGAQSIGVACGEQEGRSRTPHMDRDNCDDYKYQHDGDTNGGRWRGGEGEPGLLTPPRRCLRLASQVSQRFGCGSRRGEGEGADVGVGAGVGIEGCWGRAAGRGGRGRGAGGGSGVAASE